MGDLENDQLYSKSCLPPGNKNQQLEVVVVVSTYPWVFKSDYGRSIFGC